MTAGAVPTATADQSVVAEAVKDTVAKGAMGILAGERDAQPPPQHRNEQSWLIVQLRFFTGHGLQEEASTSSRDEAEVSPSRYGGYDRVRESRIRTVVNGLGQHFLRQINTSQVMRHMGVGC